MPCRCRARMDPAFSTTTCTFTSGRKRCAKCATMGVAQNNTDVGPQSPSLPAPTPAVVSC
eukprot:3673673-Alexandrium_andersonii.AAC.1